MLELTFLRGLVVIRIGREDDVNAGNLAEHVAGLVLTNDVSARDIQLPQGQYYEGKSYPTFTPTGPALVLFDAADWRRFTELRLRLWVNGELRQNMTAEDMLYKPVEALQALTRFQQLEPGDLILTGTPVGTAVSAPPKPVAMLMALVPPATKWKMFFTSQAKNPKYLHLVNPIFQWLERPRSSLGLD